MSRPLASLVFIFKFPLSAQYPARRLRKRLLADASHRLRLTTHVSQTVKVGLQSQSQLRLVQPGIWAGQVAANTYTSVRFDPIIHCHCSDALDRALCLDTVFEILILAVLTRRLSGAPVQCRSISAGLFNTQ